MYTWYRAAVVSHPSTYIILLYIPRARIRSAYNNNNNNNTIAVHIIPSKQYISVRYTYICMYFILLSYLHTSAAAIVQRFLR